MSRAPTPEERQVFGPDIAELVLALLGTGAVESLLFDPGETSPEDQVRFAHSDAVFDATFAYASQLMALWATQQGGKRLKLRTGRRRGAATQTVVPLLPPPLTATPIGPDAAAEQAEHARHAALPGEDTRMTQSETSPQDAALNRDETRSADSSAVASDMAPQPVADSTDPPSINLRPGEVPPAATPAARPADPQVRFRLPNAKVGTAYAAALEVEPSASSAGGGAVRILDLRLPDGLGLHFDPASGRLTGTPRLAGDHRLAVRWSQRAGESYSGECLLIVNPDPRSLWKVQEPPPDAPYPKDHRDAAHRVGDGYQILAASRRGRSHAHAGSFRDDDFLVRHDPASGWSVLIVADGAGSAQFSREGARLAVAAAGEHLMEQLSGAFGARMQAALDGWTTDPGTAQAMGMELHALFHQASSQAVQAIEDAAQQAAASPRDFSTTLLAAAVQRRGAATFIASFWMGDGAIAVYGPRGKVRLMGTPDGGEFAGQTRFLDRAALADQGFAKRIGIGYFEDLQAVILMTDGISDPRFETDSGLADGQRWDALWDELSPLLSTATPAEALVDWLDFFSQGNHDDRTIAILW